MQTSNRFTLPGSLLKPLAACVAAVFGLAAHDAQAATDTVSNCNDSGPGSLRAVVGAATSGDIIEMSGLTTSAPGCSASTISLHTGAINISQNNLSLIGPSPNRLTISGKYNGATENDRVLNHTGTGQLSVIGLNIKYGAISSSAAGATIDGGCIQSAGNVYLLHSTVALCTLTENGSGFTAAKGGGIWAANGVSLKYSTVEHNSATASASGRSFGGGVYGAGGTFTMFNSTVYGNTADGAGTSGFAGGVFARGRATISYSTISGNHATAYAGGLALIGSSGAGTSVITNSTISGNSAGRQNGGLALSNASTTISNSTIAFNTVTTPSAGGSGGLYAANITGSAFTITLQSSILSNNTSTGADDFNIRGPGVTVAGSDNLVFHADFTLPPGITSVNAGVCPLLGPLANNGGPTQTHALFSGSPALGKGNNDANLNYDQRGIGYPRLSSPATVPDIGAYEVQRADIIFNSGFEGCP